MTLDRTPRDRYPDSYYAATLDPAPRARPALRERVRADVCVVGAGYTGLYTALRLAEAGKRVVLLEAARVGWGASGRNGGQAILGFSCEMSAIAAQLGQDAARDIWSLVRSAAAEIRQRIATHAIDCDWQDGHLWTAVLPRRVQALHDWQAEAATRWGYAGLQFIDRTELPNWLNSPRYQAALYDPEAGHLHPLKYALGLAAAAESLGVQLYETSPVQGYRAVGNHIEVETNAGRVDCDALVLACNVYLGELDRPLSRRILPVSTYMVATEPLGRSAASLIPSKACVTDNQFILDYFRIAPDSRLLIGGGCSYLGGMPRDIRTAMQPILARVFPQLDEVRLDYAWGGLIDCTLKRTPDFGQRGNVFWAQGFSGHGIIPTCIAGRVLAEAILDDDRHLRQFMQLHHPAYPANRRLAGALEAAGKAWYRARDLF